MNTPINPQPPVAFGCEATDHGGGHTCDAAEGAKDHWLQTGRHCNLNLTAFNARMLSSYASIAVLFEELASIKWDIFGLSEVRKTDEEYIVLGNGHVLCYRGLVGSRELGVAFFFNNDKAGNIEVFYSINERVAGLVVKLNKRCKLKAVQAYAPTSSHDDEIAESFYQDVETAMTKVKTQYTVLMVDFNAEAGKKQAADLAVGEYGIGFRNSRGELLVHFT